MSPSPPPQKLKIGISACLLGESVRYDGGNCLQRELISELSPYVEWIRICPEMSMGLGTPRPTMRLEKGSSLDAPPSLIVPETKKDLSALAQKIATALIQELPPLDGFILKKNSPSCGLERVNVYNEHSIPTKSGSGIFANALKKAFPQLPMIEEGRLLDPRQKEHFYSFLFTHAKFNRLEKSPSALQEFQQIHKFLFMMHDPENQKKMGRLSANPTKEKIEVTFNLYEELLTQTLRQMPTKGKRINVLQHLYGYFKKSLSKKEALLLRTRIEEYAMGKVSYSVPLLLLEHYTKKLEEPYLLKQTLFEPYPEGLCYLRSAI